jgi:hypothetical protein
MHTIPAVVVHPNGQTDLIHLEDGYKAIQEIVGGTFDVVTSETGKTSFWIHDEGKLIGLTPNFKATKVLWKLNSAFEGRDYLAGTVLITGGANDEGETLGIGDEGLTVLQIQETEDNFFEGLGM